MKTKANTNNKTKPMAKPRRKEREYIISKTPSLYPNTFAHIKRSQWQSQEERKENAS